MLSWIGGKSRIGKWLIEYYPNDMEIYTESFGGMMWCYFNMDLSKYPNLKKIVYNDLNPLNYNLFQCIKNPSRLLEEINKIPCQEKGVFPTPEICKEQFIKFQSEIFKEGFNVGEYNYEVAAKYVYVVTQVFSGSKPETSSFIDLKGKYKSKYLTFRDKLSKPDWVEYFLNITHIENMDFEDLILKYDSDKTFHYVDAPYWKTENYYNNHDFDSKDHERLANTLKRVKGKFGMSYYDFPQLQVWFPQNQYQWERKLFAKAAAAKKGKVQTMGEEILIMNYKN
jgi:DNA adenine methylase